MFVDSLNNNGGLLMKLTALFKTFCNIYKKGFDMVAKPGSFGLLVAMTVNHNHWVF
jgi:hypothetical protein